jgi:hypothetical protein
LVLPPLTEWEAVLAWSIVPFLGAEILKILNIAPPDRA